MTTLTAQLPVVSRIAAVASAIATGVYDFLDAIAAAQWRATKFEELNALTDAQLAERGLTRQDIPSYIFSDVIDV